MHVIVLQGNPSAFRGGQELSLLDVCRGLAHRNHSITLLYVNEGDLLKQYDDFCSHIIHLQTRRIDKINFKSAPSILRLLADIQKVPKSKNTVVYINNSVHSFLGSTLALSKITPLVCHLRVPPPETFNRQWSMGLKGVKQFIAVSNQTKSDWVSRGLEEKKIDVVYNGINLEVFKPSGKLSKTRKEWGVPEDTKVISYVGRLDREKGLETLIRAFALLLKSGTSTRLLIAGKPLCHPSPEEGEKYNKSLEKLSIDLGVEKHVNFLGHVTAPSSIYQISDVTVLPSLWAEAFGRTIIEAMACGTPVVASRTGGIPEILTGEFQSGLFEPGNERDLSDKLNFIMNWRDRSPHFGERCREHVLSKFSLDNMVDGVEKVLLSVVKQ